MTGIVRSTVQVFTDGPPAAKIATTGFAVIWAALSETATGILFAGVVIMWGLDMVIGTIRAAAEGNFRFRAFLEGFGKGLAALVGIAIGVVLDTVGANVIDAYDAQIAAAAAMGGLFTAFAWSAVENFAYWFPETADRLRSIIRRKQEPPPADWYKLDERTRTQIRAIVPEDVR